MKKLMTIALALVLSIGAKAQFSSAPAFPGAEGYGRYVTGGRGGTVYHVTSLKDDANVLQGTLRYGIEKISGARIIVFDVGGTIELYKDLKITNGNITIYGQTAPGQGICLAGYPVTISANNVIMRYVRCRMGDLSQEEADALSASFHAGSGKKNIIIDHCSVSWSTDECASFYGNENFTLQWCLVSESLRNSVHSKDKHGYGGIWGGTRASYHHNLLAHHDSRNARLDHDYVNNSDEQLIDYINNGFYNWGGNNTYGGESKGKGGSHYRKVNFVGNYYKPGPATGSSSKSWIMNLTNECGNCDSNNKYNIEPAHLYLTGNIMVGNDAINANNWSGIHPDVECDVTQYKSDTKWQSSDSKFTGYNTVTVQPAAVAFQKLLEYAGCSIERDAVDSRICHEAESGTYTYNGSKGSTNGLIDSQSDVKGWPTLIGGTVPTDTDGDGMSDEWETLNGLNPNDASDATLYTLDSNNYYTNVEVYCNQLVEERVKAERAEATESFDEYFPPAKYYKTIVVETPVTQGEVTYNITQNTGEASSVTDYTGTISDALSGYLDDASIDCGEILGWAGTTFNDKDNVTLAQFTNGSAKTETEPEVKADGSDDSAVTFSIVVADNDENYKVRIMGMDFYAAKNGTNAAATVSASIDGTTTVVSSQDLPRAQSSTEDAKSAYHCSVTDLAPSAVGSTTAKIAFTGGAGGKQLGLSDVKFTVSIVKVETQKIIVDPTGIEEVPASVSVPVSKRGYYNLAGQRVSPNAKGLIIFEGKKIFR
ncbi:MAG: hypothetical protein IKO28_04400 [Prevotella sp.]|nr:hypothetical protein [Prevotella sp.]